MYGKFRASFCGFLSGRYNARRVQGLLCAAAPGARDAAGAAQKRAGLRQVYFDEASGARRTGERRAHPAHPLRQRPRQSGRGGIPAAETRHHRRHRTPCGGAGSPRRRRAGAEFVPHHRRRCPALPQGRGDRPVCPKPAAAQPGGAVCGLGGQPAAGQPPRRSLQCKL